MTTRWFNSSSAGLVILGFLLICISACLAQENGDIRLVDGEEQTEGRVEVYQSGVWGTVCDDGWTIQEADVVCYQLGFGPAAASLTKAHFGKGTGPILMDDVQCSGQEQRLADCVFRGGGNNCGHNEDASVICTNVSDGEIRLVGGGSQYEGTLEIYLNGQWVRVCIPEWTPENAKVVCRQLGYENVTQYLSYSLFGHDDLPVLLDKVFCTGAEARLKDCSYSVVSNCHVGTPGSVGLTCDTPASGNVRLLGGTGPQEGRVEVLVDDEWGAVCDDEWDLNDAHVVCRQLGFPGALSAVSKAHFGMSQDPVNLDDVDCNGDENSLLECVHTARDKENCHFNEGAGVVCQAKSSFITEVNPTQDPPSGNCEELAFPMCSDMPYSLTQYPNSFGHLTQAEAKEEANLIFAPIIPLGCPAAFFQVMCLQLAPPCPSTGISGYPCRELCEAGLNECIRKLQSNLNLTFAPDIDCSLLPSSDSGLCLTEDLFKSPIVEEGSIRLAGGNETAGRVEIYFNGEWGTVCDDGWDIYDANVVCNQLGFARALEYRGSAAFGEGTGEIHLDDVGCGGDETELLSCYYSSIDNCNHGEDAGVSCQFTSNEPTPEEGSIRLAEGNETAGRVEIFLNGEWGTVCDDRLGIEEAHVVCRQLGFDRALNYFDSSGFGPGTGEIHLDNVVCSGEETELLSCSYSSIDDCNHGEDAGVSCQFTSNEPTPEEGSIRLAEGNETAGRVEIFLNGEWGTVCDDAWGIDEANVVCNQLGFVRALEFLGSAAFGEGTGEIHLDDVRCSGKETELLSCYYNSIDNCGHYEDAGVICQLTSIEPTPEEGSIRLAGGNETAGRVEIFLNGEWGTVCDDAWGIDEANVVCNQLGFVRALEFRGGAAFGEGTGEIHLDDVGCSGKETELLSCYYNSIDNCNHYEDASVICQLTSNEPTPDEGELRLADEGAYNEGRLLVYLNGQWGTVCDDGFTEGNGNIACKQLGFDGVVSFSDSGGGEISLPINMDDVACTGREERLIDCPHTTTSNCIHNEDVRLVCSAFSLP